MIIILFWWYTSTLTFVWFLLFDGFGENVCRISVQFSCIVYKLRGIISLPKWFLIIKYYKKNVLMYNFLTKNVEYAPFPAECVICSSEQMTRCSSLLYFQRKRAALLPSNAPIKRLPFSALPHVFQSPYFNTCDCIECMNYECKLL